MLHGFGFAVVIVVGMIVGFALVVIDLHNRRAHTLCRVLGACHTCRGRQRDWLLGRFTGRVQFSYRLPRAGGRGCVVC